MIFPNIHGSIDNHRVWPIVLAMSIHRHHAKTITKGSSPSVMPSDLGGGKRKEKKDEPKKKKEEKPDASLGAREKKRNEVDKMKPKERNRRGFDHNFEKAELLRTEKEKNQTTKKDTTKKDPPKKNGTVDHRADGTDHGKRDEGALKRGGPF